MENQYGMDDLRQCPIFPSIQPPPPDLLPSHRGLTAAQHYEMVMVGQHTSDMVHHGLHQDFHADSTTTSSVGFSGLEIEAGGGLAGDGGTGRWPRQETLTLLEIRSRLDSKFKEANQKGPLWDEVSRIMSEEHGYQRSGKKCREKFENLYKYYKKTKEGKAGRQDGKHYRFFRQLEALYGESSHGVSASEHHYLHGNSFQYNAANTSVTPPNHHQEPFQYSLSLSNSSDFETTSSDDSDVNITMENDSVGKRKKRSKRNWKAKIKDFIDDQMKKLMEKQEAWLEKMMKTIEHKEHERMMKEQQWRKQEEARIEKEHKFWAKERAWIGARDTALMEALQKLTGNELIKPSLNENPNHQSWQECEITRLIQFRTAMETRFDDHHGCDSETLWEEISAKMASLGYEKSSLMCKEKWDSINDYYLMKCNKNGKENSNSCGYFQNIEGLNNNQGGDYNCDDHHSEASNANCSTSNIMHDGSRYLMGDAENLWENYGLKISKGDNNLS